MTALSIIIPNYGGAEELKKGIGDFCDYLQGEGFDYELILVDDGSPNNDAEQIKALASARIRPLILEQNRGKFGAIRAGIAEAKGRVCLFTDADLPYDPRVIRLMFDLVDKQGFHIVVGDRTLPGSIYRAELGPIRRLATSLFTLFVRLLVTSGLFDTQCGIKAFRADAASALFEAGQEDGFAGDVEILYIALINNLAIRRVPARLIHQGPSTVSAFRDALGMLRGLWRMRRRRYRGHYNSPALERVADQDYWSKS